jgi:DHA2 family multidrug resistance protein-like MFS transporter
LSEAAVGVQADGLAMPRRGWAVLTIGIGIAMSVLDGTVANIALPAMARELGARPSSAVWIINAYQLATVMTLLPFAALGERLSYRLVYRVGVAVFTLASLACALSPNLTVLIIARVAQGIGAAGLMSVNGALVRYTYPHASLGRGVGINAVVVAVAAAVGPSLAAGILALGNWHWLFAVNVPFGIAALVLAMRVLPASPPSDETLDYGSAVLNAAAFGLFFIGTDALIRASAPAWAASLALVTAAVCGTALVLRERLSGRPLVPLDLLAKPVFALSVVASICAFAAYMLAFVVLPFFLQSVLHRDQVATGLLMTPWPVAVGITAMVAGRLSDRLPAAVLGGVGMTLLAVSLGLLAMLTAHATDFDVCWRMALGGAGFGFFQAPNNRVLLSSAPRSRAGAAGGMLATARLLGVTTGALLAGLVFHLAAGRAEALGLGIGAALSVGAGVASVGRLGK